MIKTISITEFKAKCLSYIREVNEKGMHIIITKHGKTIAEVQPPARKNEVNPLKGSVLMQKDIISPVETEWEALKD